jgi:hypothetical protein
MTHYYYWYYYYAIFINIVDISLRHFHYYAITPLLTLAITPLFIIDITPLLLLIIGHWHYITPLQISHYAIDIDYCHYLADDIIIIIIDTYIIDYIIIIADADIYYWYYYYAITLLRWLLTLHTLLTLSWHYTQPLTLFSLAIADTLLLMLIDAIIIIDYLY